MPRLTRLAVILFGLSACAPCAAAADFESDVVPIVRRYCWKCHAGDDANGDVDLKAIRSLSDVKADVEVWDSVVENLRHGAMPPDDEPQPSEQERQVVYDWFESLLSSVEAQPAEFRPRRLSVHEYRQTLRSVLGFDLQVAIIEAEQTLSERSMVVKLLPTDPPGESGFTNDTHSNPLTIVVWDQYSYLIDTALEELFSNRRRAELEALTGPLPVEGLQLANAKRVVQTVIRRAWRRDLVSDVVEPYLKRLEGVEGKRLEDALRFELKTILMSPRFIYRGLLHRGESGRRPVDGFELAERLSYFLWADMPDEQLLAAAAAGDLDGPDGIAAAVDRMLASPKARNLAEDFAVQWLSLREIEHASNNPPVMVALKSQPIDFMHYLFTEDRPLLELINSDVAFISPHTARYYGADSRQMKRYSKQKGIEIEIVANQRIQLRQTKERGGILTMPGVLAMNRGPILRGVWMLERILGDELPEPPANVGQVPKNQPGKKLTFRQRFEQHRSNPTCAVCHDKIDPLGFSLQTFDGGGRFVNKPTKKPPKKRKGSEAYDDAAGTIDTSGQLPSGEKFADIQELKQILATSQREAVVRNIVEKTMSYALCRKLTIYDRPTVRKITDQMLESNGGWRDLFHAIALSPSFRETIIPAPEQAAQ